MYGQRMWLFQFPDFLISLVCPQTRKSSLLLLTSPEISSKELANLGLFASVLGHIGDGNFHSSIMYNKSDPAERGRVEKIVHDMVDRALEMGGSCTVMNPLLLSAKRG